MQAHLIRGRGGHQAVGFAHEQNEAGGAGETGNPGRDESAHQPACYFTGHSSFFILNMALA